MVLKSSHKHTMPAVCVLSERSWRLPIAVETASLLDKFYIADSDSTSFPLTHILCYAVYQAHELPKGGTLAAYCGLIFLNRTLCTFEALLHHVSSC
eukprot:m.294787 g.294787  ORF g.294787 m.294787 type:complete len:96 (-) comp49940_c0_seq1:1840-2127(-)